MSREKAVVAGVDAMNGIHQMAKNRVIERTRSRHQRFDDHPIHHSGEQ